MSREIGSSITSDFPPMVGLREKGNYVKGKVLALGQTTAGNPVATLQLIDLDGSTSRSVSKGVYAEVDVNVGDAVQVVGSAKQLKDKLPQLAVGDIVTITFNGKDKMASGRSINKFKVVVEE